MRILYDITTLANIHCAKGVNPTGIYRHTEAMALALSEMPEIDLRLSCHPSQLNKAFRYLCDLNHFPLTSFPVVSTSVAVILSGLHGAVYSTHLKDGELQRAAIEYYKRNYHPDRVFNGKEFDIYHVNWRGEDMLPPHSGARVVLTIYDVIALKKPEWFVKGGQRNNIGDYLTTLIRSVKRHHTLTVSTNSVKDDLLELFDNLAADQIFITPLGVSDRFYPVFDSVAIKEIKEKYKIPSDSRYILCLNTLEPRKNMKAVIEAYENMIADIEIDDVCLVLAGGAGWLYDDIVKIVKSYGNSGRGKVCLTGYVDDDDLAPLYSGASVFCYPSLDEGFGLPVLEAMKCGVPVVTSDCSAMKEIAKGVGVLVVPTDINALSDALHKILTDRSYASILAEQSIAHAEKYSWRNSAKSLLSVYSGIL